MNPPLLFLSVICCVVGGCLSGCERQREGQKPVENGRPGAERQREDLDTRSGQQVPTEEHRAMPGPFALPGSETEGAELPGVGVGGQAGGPATPDAGSGGEQRAVQAAVVAAGQGDEEGGQGGEEFPTENNNAAGKAGAAGETTEAMEQEP